MSNNHYERKDYSSLLDELQKKQVKKTKDTIESKVVSEDKNASSDTIKDDNIDYDLDTILSAINDLKDLTNIYNYCENQIEHEQEITQDLLHAIEFSDNCKDRYRLSTLLHLNRQRRRFYKNTVTTLKPLIDYINKDDIKKCLNKLTNILGESRKIKQNETNKSYNPRVLTELGEIINEK